MTRAGNCGEIKVYFSGKLLIIYENSPLVKKLEHLFQKMSVKKTFVSQPNTFGGLQGYRRPPIITPNLISLCHLHALDPIMLQLLIIKSVSQANILTCSE